MTKPTRTFNGIENQKSTGTGGPDQIEYDLDEINKMFDPDAGYGIDTENLCDGSVTDDIIGERTVDEALAGGADTGTLTQLLSWIAKTLKAAVGGTDWYSTAAATIAAIWAKFHATTGHAHTGAANDGPKVAASVITNTPSGTVAATDVQTAINELDSEKVATSLVVDVAAANKILKLDVNSKLPTSVTGDADDTVSKLNTHKSSSDHDSRYDARYYTQTKLQTSGQASVHWDNLTNVPNLADSSWKPAVASYAALPTTGNTVGDMRVVADDGDGKSAMYRCKANTGALADQWEKIADLDWTNDHGALSGLADDDHSQYHNDTRGDARYYTQDQLDTALGGKSDTGHNHNSAYISRTGGVVDGALNFQGNQAQNLVEHTGIAFPGSPTAGQRFYRSDLAASYIYTGLGGWVKVSGLGAQLKRESFTGTLNGPETFNITVGQYETGANQLLVFVNGVLTTATEASATSFTVTVAIGNTVVAWFFQNAPSVELATHLSDTAPHSAVSAATASRLMIRDASSRVKIADGAASDDAASKGQVDTVDGHVGTLGNLRTTEKGSVVGAINEVVPTGLSLGDVLYRGASAFSRLPIGSAGQVLKVNDAGNGIEWTDDLTGRVQNIGGFDSAIFSDCALDGVKAVLVGTTDQIPTMSGASAPSGTASADSELSGTYPAWKAMDDNTATSWNSAATAFPHYLRYQFASGIVAGGYSVTARGGTEDPKSWTFQGSNNGVDWTTLHTVTDAANFSAYEKRTYLIPNTTSYAYYQLNVTNTRSGAGQTEVAELEIFVATISGTVAIDTAPENLYEWMALYFNTVIPASPGTQAVACAVKDTSDNVLIASAADGEDLSGIDSTEYEEIRLVWTLSRVSVVDASPELHPPNWTYLGPPEA